MTVSPPPPRKSPRKKQPRKSPRKSPGKTTSKTNNSTSTSNNSTSNNNSGGGGFFGPSAPISTSVSIRNTVAKNTILYGPYGAVPYPGFLVGTLCEKTRKEVDTVNWVRRVIGTNPVNFSGPLNTGMYTGMSGGFPAGHLGGISSSTTTDIVEKIEILICASEVFTKTPEEREAERQRVFDALDEKLSSFKSSWNATVKTHPTTMPHGTGSIPTSVTTPATGAQTTIQVHKAGQVGHSGLARSFNVSSYSDQFLDAVYDACQWQRFWSVTDQVMKEFPLLARPEDQIRVYKGELPPANMSYEHVSSP